MEKKKRIAVYLYFPDGYASATNNFDHVDVHCVSAGYGPKSESIMDGEAFAKELREHSDLADVAVVVVSTEANRARLERMREYGVRHTLRKPFEPEELCRLITEVLGVATDR
jgi:CheY-like chemotaxis protein